MPGSTPAVAVVGSINIDLVAMVDRHALPGETVLAADYAEVVGGKGFNQASAVARRLPSWLVGCVGDDAFGARAVEAARDRGVRVDQVARAGVPTGRAFIEVGPGGENSIVVAPLANHAVTSEQVVAALDRVRPAAVLAQLEIPFGVVAAVAGWCEANGARFTLNPSPAASLPASVAGPADPLIVNEWEAARLLDELRPAERRDAADHAGAARSLRAVARSVVVTAGSRGAAFATAEGAGHVPAERVRAVDTTGAGDEFAGALVASLVAGESFARAVESAGAAAAALVATPRSER